MICHGPERKGAGNFPSLQEGVHKKYSSEQFDALVLSGRRMMPGFKHLTEEERKALASFVLEQTLNYEKPFASPVKPINEYINLPYWHTGYHTFRTKEGYPAIKPPWGTLNAINLNTGEYEWKIPLGEFAELRAKGIPATGSENYGGPVVTSGGLVFIAATRDNKLRAFNKRTGKLLWEYTLPFSGFATPAVYSINGKQYLVVACGGGKLNTLSGDAYVAFSLTDRP
jgi:quinoprotein glucose dehydrogenase